MSAVLSSGLRNSSDPSIRMAPNPGSTVPLSSLVYQSRAKAPLSEAELQRLVSSAQARNRTEGVTGLLIYDQGRFMHWLEGPTTGLGRVWDAIRNDGRHGDVSVLGEAPTPARCFGDSPLALAKRPQGPGDRARGSVVELPAELIETLYQSPQAAPSLLASLAPQPVEEALQAKRAQRDADQEALRHLVEGVIVPGLIARHARPTPATPDVEPRAAELARLLVAAEPRAAFALIDALRADGRSITQLCTGLFEPASRVMGDLWLSDDCNEFEVVLGLSHLQGALRRVSLETSSIDVPTLSASVPHAVLVAPSPHEQHMLGSVIASEMFWRAGWDVACEFPDSDAALSQLVHDRWFDVLDLSLSGAFTREDRLPAMAASIRAVHARSQNPELTVIVDGRVFHERPSAGDEVGADAASGSAKGLTAMARSAGEQRARKAARRATSAR